MREIQGLQNYNNPGQLEQAHFCFHVSEVNEGEKNTEPKAFEDAWYNKDPEEREKWKQAIREEFKQMKKNNVWDENNKIWSLPKGRKGIGTKWVFKKKNDGRYRARLVAKGYTQEAGVDFQYNYAPVVTDTTMKILFTLWITNDYKAKTLDVKTAFLYSELSEELYLKRPEGYQEYLEERGAEQPGDFVLLNKSIYGLVQSAREWWYTMARTLRRYLNFEQFENDNCLFVYRDDDYYCAIGMYVDDCIMIGTDEGINRTINGLKEHYEITVNEVDNFIGCKIEKTGRALLLHQPELLDKLEKTFGEDISKIRICDTPAAMGYRITRPREHDKLLSEEEQTRYRSGVGSLLYLIKFTRPDISNMTRELSKVMDGATKEHWKSLLKTIRYVIATKSYKLLMETMMKDVKEMEIRGYSDSDYAGDSDDRRSISGHIIYLNGCPVSWRSKGQKSVSLSSTEAEYKAISDLTTEVMFVKMTTNFLGMKAKLPMEIRVDNTGAIYLAKSASGSSRTKHIDTHYHYVRECIENGELTVKFVRSAANKADIFTKNLGKEYFERHRDDIMGLEALYFNEEGIMEVQNRKGVDG